MDKYNIVFIKTENGEKELLGRRAEDYVLREFADFSAKSAVSQNGGVQGGERIA